MVDAHLGELVDRLRGLTGHQVSQRPVTSVAKKIDAESLLILQQSLRRHPCLTMLALTRSESMQMLLTEVDEACATQPDSSTNVLQLCQWINEVATGLETERAGAVYADADSFQHTVRSALLASLGFDSPPSNDQNMVSFPCPWNVPFTLLSGSLFEYHFLHHKRSVLRVPNATASVLSNLSLIDENCHDTVAWSGLLQQINDFPVVSVRSVWHAALYFFPTSGPLVHLYLKKEVDLVKHQPRMWDCGEEADAKSLYKDYLRILNFFFRHLPICFSCDLYALFFDFVEEYVQPDEITLDTLYRSCLRRDVGNIPHSTPLWTRYLKWKSAAIQDGNRRREWTKKMFYRVLQLPLLDLDKVKEEYDEFIAVGCRGRLDPDDKSEIDKRLPRIKADANELVKQMSLFMPGGVCSSHQHTSSSGFPRHLYLPRPLSLSEEVDVTSHSMNLRLLEMDLWAAWHTILDHVSRPLFPGGGSDLLHCTRQRTFLTMRACFFPHQEVCWSDLINHCVHHQGALSEAERRKATESALDLAMMFMRNNIFMDLFFCDIQVNVLGNCERAYRRLKEALLWRRSVLLVHIREETRPMEPGVVLPILQNIVTLSVNWMRLNTQQSSKHHIALVARYTMQHVDFLSLTMAVLKRLLKQKSIASPSAFLRPFNTFCYHWIQLELVRNKHVADALQILRQWKEHLKMVLVSAKGRAWRPERCGADESFIKSCHHIVRAGPAEVSNVCAIVAELEDSVATNIPSEGVEFGYLCRLFYHSCFTERSPEHPVRTFAMPMERLLCKNAPPQRYDTKLFASNLAWKAEEKWLRDHTNFSVSIAATAPDDTISETYPEEVQWMATSMGHSASHHRGPPRRRRPADGGMAQAHAFSPRVSKASTASKRGLVHQAVHLMDLGEVLTLHTTTNNHDGESATGRKEQPLGTLEELIMQLPTQHQYDPSTEGITLPATEWLLELLSGCEAL